jgi:hypothetical protein
MRKILFSFAAGLLACGASAQSLKISDVGTGVFCRFSSSSQVTPTQQTDSYTTTNGEATCVLTSASFPGTTQNAAGQYGYEYQIALNNTGVSATNVVKVNSLTLDFGEPVPFAYGEHASNQVWVLTSDTSFGPGPSSASASDKQVTFTFDPPLTLDTSSDQTTNTCYFGMASDSAPEVTSAILSGTTENATNGVAVPFKVQLQAQTP